MLHLEARPRRILLRLALIGLTLLVHGSVLSHDFVDMDDPQTIEDNPRLKSPTLINTLYYWNNRGLELYIPCTYTAWALTAALSGRWRGSEYVLRPTGFHLANLACHLLCVLVIFEILQRLIDSPDSAGLGAALFAVHPLQVEAIAWATGLKDVLRGLAALVAIWQYLVAMTPRPRPDGKSATLRGPYALATLAFAIAVLAKPAGVAAIGVAAVLDRCLHKTPLRQISVRLLPWSIVGTAIATIAHHVQPAGEVSGNSLILRPLIALDAVWFYLWKVLWPMQLSPDYGRRPMAVIDHGWIAWTWAIPLTLGWLVWSVRSKKPLIAASAGVFVMGLLPTLGLIPFIYQRHSTVADRYTYLAMLGPAMMLACWVHGYHRLRLPAVIIITLFSICSMNQEAIWKNSLELFAYAVQVTPSAPFNHLNYGVALAGERRFDEAAAQFRQTLALSPQNPQARENLDLLQRMTGTARGPQP